MFDPTAFTLAMALLGPVATAADFESGNAFVADATLHEVFEFHHTTGDTVRRFGSGVEGFDAPWDLAFAPDGLLYVTTSGSDRVFAFSGGGVLESSFDLSAVATGLRALCVGPDGTLWIAAHDSDSVVNVSRSGAVIRVVPCPAGHGSPIALNFGRRSTLWVATREAPAVVEFNYEGVVQRVVPLPTTPTAMTSRGAQYLHLTLEDDWLHGIDDTTGELFGGIVPVPKVAGLAVANDHTWYVTINGTQVTRMQFQGFANWGVGELVGAKGVAVAPYWAKSTLKFSGVNMNGFAKSFSEKVWLGLFTGEHQLLVRFEPGGELADAFSLSGVALPGVDRFRPIGPSGKDKFAHTGRYFANLPRQESLSIEVEAILKGFPQKHMKTIEGRIHVSDYDLIGGGKLKLAKVK